MGARERGQALPLLTMVLVVAAALAFVVVEVGIAAVDRAAARAAADAAALAGAAEGVSAARAVAVSNRGELRAWYDDGRTVEVVVAVGRARATATAERAAMVVTPPGGGQRDGLAPVLVAALARADSLLGRAVPVVSVDGDGMGFEVEASSVDDVRAVSEAAGLCQPLVLTHPVHFAPCPPTSQG